MNSGQESAGFMSKAAIAMEELKLLQGIIARQDEFTARAKQWATGAVVALAATGAIHFTGFIVFVIIVLSTLSFAIVDGLFGAAEQLAEGRVEIVELALQTPGAPSYNGPSIYDSMTDKVKPRLVWKSIVRVRTLGFYAALVGFGGIASGLVAYAGQVSLLCE